MYTKIFLPETISFENYFLINLLKYRSLQILKILTGKRLRTKFKNLVLLQKMGTKLIQEQRSCKLNLVSVIKY